MQWKKIRNLFCPNNNYTWMFSHAANPFAENISTSIFRVYFTCRNSQNESHIAYVDVDFNDDFKIIDISNKPVLTPGEIGMFDDSGTAMGFLINIAQKKYLYYLGWNLKVKVPWLNTIGLAVWNTEKQIFEKYSRAPLMDRSNEDPFTISYPSILYDNNIYRMWYGSNLKWGKSAEDMDHVIKYAESIDGISWTRTNQIHINLNYPDEYAISKPWVMKVQEKYEMWYSYRSRGKTYRIGYAESTDGYTWERKDAEAGINVSDSEWDGEMICYPCVFDFNGKRYMLYNGNCYGKTGFGIAILQ